MKTLLGRLRLIRNVCDLKSLAVRIASKGSVLEGTVSAPLFVSSAKQLTSTIADISDDVLEKNYKQFVKVLEGHLATKKLDKLTSKDLIKDFSLAAITNV